MNFFKKALIATAVAGTFGTVQAADVTNAVTKSSIQGLEVATAVDDASVRVIVREKMEVGDVITLVFGKDMFSTLPLTVALDQGQVAATTTIAIDYGTGTYEMSGTVSTTAGVTTAVLTVLVGDPLIQDSSFEVKLTGADLDKAKASSANVTYSAVSGLTGDAKDTTGTNFGNFIVTADQYAASVKAQLDGVIERTSQTTFIRNGETATGTDGLTITLTDDQTLNSAAATGVATVTVFGDFGNGTAEITLPTAITGVTFADVGVAADKKSYSFTLTATAGLAGEYVLLLDNALAGSDKIKASDFTATVVFDADGAGTAATKFTAVDKGDAGEWKIDAAIINVPYLVVGKEGTSSSVHFSNLGPKADVIVEAVSVIDADGKAVTYDAVDLGFDLESNSVTKVSQLDLIDVLGIPAGTQKLSVTFNIDGKAEDVSAYAFTTSETGRAEISNSQQKD
jgi:hypothetical protein